MSTAETLRLTESEYLRRERAAAFKSEFYRGEVFAMAGAIREHNLIAANLIRSVGNALADSDCEVYPGDMRIKVSATGLYTYPDLSVACGKPRFEDLHGDTLLNPLLLFEILSDSTEKYDRGAKAAQYRQVSSLQEYVLVSQTGPRIEVYQRRDDGRWLLSEAASLADSIQLESIDVCIALADVYRQVVFAAPETDA